LLDERAQEVVRRRLRLLDPRNVLGAGHDDVVGKPFDRDEAAAVGCRGRDRLVEGGGERLWRTTVRMRRDRRPAARRVLAQLSFTSSL